MEALLYCSGCSADHNRGILELASTAKNNMVSNKKAQIKRSGIRIIAGKWRGRRLPVVAAEGLRPTTDRVRETVFNWLMHDLAGARCLDLFAGSGGLGLESISRGASFVQFVELDRQVAQSISAALTVLDVAQLAASGGVTTNVYCGAAQQFLATHTGPVFEIVYLDPPYQSGLLSKTAVTLEESKCLAPTALIYVEYSSQDTPPDLPTQWRLLREGRAGHSYYCLYQRSGC